MGVTKTDFVRGLQCPKMLWLDSHKPAEKLIPAEVQVRLNKGNEFGDRAMGLFGEYLETTTYRADGKLDYAAMLEKTSRYLLVGTPVICEAAFSWYGNYCAADILRKTEGGYELYEVKNSEMPRKEFLIDLGFQSFLIGKSGVSLAGRFLVLRDKNGGFRIADETKAAKLYERTAEKKIWELASLKKRETPEPRIAVGEQCERPYECWYYGYCHKNCK